MSRSRPSSPTSAATASATASAAAASAGGSPPGKKPSCPLLFVRLPGEVVGDGDCEYRRRKRTDEDGDRNVWVVMSW